MAHLTGFGLENFRVFKDYTWFDFAPITILVGPNNSGKSSLIKALLLLQDNLRKNNLPPHFKTVKPSSHSWPSGEANYIDWDEVFEPSSLEFNDRAHGLNNPSTTKSRFCDKNEFTFDIPFFVITSFKKRMTGKQFFGTNSKTNDTAFLSQLQKISKEFTGNSVQYTINRVGIEAWENKLAFPLLKRAIYRLSFKIENDLASSIQKLEIRDEDLKLILKISPNKIYFDPAFYSEYLGDYSIVEGPWEKYQNEITADFGISFKYWFLQNGFEEELSIEISKKILQTFLMTEHDTKINSSAVEFLESIDYFSTSWTEQRRVYTEDQESKTINQLLGLINQQQKGFNLNSFFETYANYFGIKGKPDVEYDKTRGTIFPNIDGESLLNFGYGYSQISLLLFRIAVHATQKYIAFTGNEFVFNEENTILILEEPETNLHPSFQSKLANLLHESKDDYNIQFFIETHSEYMIRKFQYLVAKGEMKPEDIVIYYFNDPNNIPPGQKQVKKINILEDGTLSDDFGPGFYDEADNLAIDLFNLQKSRRN